MRSSISIKTSPLLLLSSIFCKIFRTAFYRVGTKHSSSFVGLVDYFMEPVLFGVLVQFSDTLRKCCSGKINVTKGKNFKFLENEI